MRAGAAPIAVVSPGVRSAGAATAAVATGAEIIARNNRNNRIKVKSERIVQAIGVLSVRLVSEQWYAAVRFQLELLLIRLFVK